MHRAFLPWQLIYKYISKRFVLATIERDRKRARNRRGAMDGDLGRDELNAPLNQFFIPFTVSHCLVALVKRWKKIKARLGSRIRLRFVSIDLANKEGVEEELIVGNHKPN